MLDERERLYALCQERMEDRKLTDKEYKDRLDLEFREIDAQAEHEYLLRLFEKNYKYRVNEHNLFVTYLLDLAPDFDILREPAFLQGEFPDIDIDYLKVVRDYLKRVWAVQHFGEANVCSIGTYGTMGVKSALKDAVRVYGLPRDEVEIICKELPDKDDDGKSLGWDKAQTLSEKLREYCAQQPEVAEAVAMLMDRRKSASVHAGGLIISNKPIADFVPLEVRSVDDENPSGIAASAWGEGLSSQALSAVGLVKFDLLVVDGLLQIATACQLIKQRHGIASISAKPGKRNWSDTSYLNDPKSLEIANRGDMRCIFQFGSEGIRAMVRKGGVTSFNDIVAYSALYRPGPMGMGMHDVYCDRKQGREQCTLHSALVPILGNTYGVMVFQEQVLKILHLIGGIPEVRCENVRKAISKKKLSEFGKYKDVFIRNAARKLGETEEYASNLWDQICSFAEYGFNKSHSCAYSFITLQQLYLMAHFPTEFYTAMLMCEDETSEMHMIKEDAKRHGIEVLPVDINRSQGNFSIIKGEDGKDRILYGFSKMKGIGAAVADRIALHQPYQSIEDFLSRFGTDGTVAKMVSSLDLFGTGDRLRSAAFTSYYKDWKQKQAAAEKRFAGSLDSYELELRSELEGHRAGFGVSDEEFEMMCRFEDDAYASWEKHCSQIEVQEEYKSKGEIKIRTITLLSRLHKIKNRREKTISTRVSRRETAAGIGSPCYDDFDLGSAVALTDPKLLELVREEMAVAEKSWYGFAWTHDLEKCEYYDGYTIDRFLDDGKTSGCIEVKLLGVQKRLTKKGTSFFYVLTVEDAAGKEIQVTMWENDYERFEKDLKVNTCMKMRVTPPSNKFSRWTFESQKQPYWKRKTRDDDDCRLVVLHRKVEKNAAKNDREILLNL